MADHYDPMKGFNVRLPPALQTRLDAVAASQRLRRAAIVRDALESYLAVLETLPPAPSAPKAP